MSESPSHTRTREQTTEEERTEQTAETESVDTCPECGGSLASDAEHGETVCEDCGLVVEEDEIDPGPGWVRRRRT